MLCSLSLLIIYNTFGKGIEIFSARQVYQRSYDICMQLYEKELLTEDSYLYIYGYSVFFSPSLMNLFAINCAVYRVS